MYNDLEKQAPTIQYVSAKTLFPIIRQLLNEHQQASFTVTGMSMWPFLCHGRDQVILDYCSLDSLKVGDILLSSRQNRAIIYFIVLQLLESISFRQRVMAIILEMAGLRMIVLLAGLFILFVKTNR